MALSVIETQNSTNLTFPALSSVQDGDLILVTVGDDSQAPVIAYNPPAGFTELGYLNHSLATIDQATYVKTASSESGGYSFQGPTVGNATLLVIRGAGTLTAASFTPLEANATTTTTNQVNASSGDMVVASFINDGAVTVATPPTGMTLAETHTGPSSLAVAYYEVLASADATYDASITWSASEQGIGSAILISEASGPAGLTIDSTDSTMQRVSNFGLTCSGATTAPTTGNTTLTNGNDTLTPASVTGSDPYTLTFAVGDLTKQVDATGYDWTLKITP